MESVSTRINNAFGYKSAETTALVVGGKGARLDLAKEFIKSKRSELMQICHGENFGLTNEQATSLEKIVEDAKQGKASIDDFFANMFADIMFNWQYFFRDFKDFVAKQPGFLKEGTSPKGVTNTPLHEIVSSGIVSGVGILQSLVNAIPTALKKQKNLTSYFFRQALASMKELSAELAQLHIAPLVELENFLKGNADIETPKQLNSDDLSNFVDYYKRSGSNKDAITIDSQNKVQLDVDAFLNDTKTKTAIEASIQVQKSNQRHDQESFNEAFGCPASGIIPALNTQIFKITEKLLMPHLDQIFSL